MLNLIDLERRWLKYKIKSYIPHITILISLIIISVITSIIFSNKNSQKDKTVQNVGYVDKNSQNTQQVVAQQDPTLQTAQANLNKTIPVVVTAPDTPLQTKQSKKVQLSPSLDFMHKMQNSIQPYYNHEIVEEKKVQEVKPPKVEVVTQQEVITQVQEEEPVVVPKTISIKRQNTQNDIYEIISRFKKNSNPALSLFVAKKYYELGDYQQAYNYALITNKINKDIESSWIIFTKSLVKLGKREKAISILKKYIKQSHSSAARVLLDEIYAGKFK